MRLALSALGALGLLACGLALGVLLSACGSGGVEDEPVSTGTVRSERVEREASITQEETEQVADHVGDGEQAGEIPASGADMTEQGGVIDFGHREGLSFLRNTVGDPEAPVLIVEYSDFQ
jgi:hypothetical protein